MQTLSTAPVVRLDPIVRFFLLAILLYLGWYLLYEFIIHPAGNIDRLLIDALTWSGGVLLELSGHQLLPEPSFDNNRYIGVQGGSFLWIGDPCNGLNVMAVFVIFIMAFPGPWKHKTWFIPLGVLTIHLVNAIRVAVLAHVVTIDYEYLNFNHDFVFYVVVYGWVFLLWYIWVKKFAPSALPRPV
jgi:exosortase family protein XrtF